MEPEVLLLHSKEPSTHHYSEPDKSHPTSWSSILITKFIYTRVFQAFSLSHFPPPKSRINSFLPLHVTCPAHPILFYLITRIIFGAQELPLSSSLCSLFHNSVTSLLLGPNILLNTLISNALNLRSSLNVSHQALHLYKTTGKIIFLRFLHFSLLGSKLEDKRFCTERKQAFSDFNQLLISSWMEYWFVTVVPKYLNCSILQRVYYQFVQCDFFS